MSDSEAVDKIPELSVEESALRNSENEGALPSTLARVVVRIIALQISVVIMQNH